MSIASISILQRNRTNRYDQGGERPLRERERAYYYKELVYLIVEANKSQDMQ